MIILVKKRRWEHRLLDAELFSSRLSSYDRVTLFNGVGSLPFSLPPTEEKEKRSGLMSDFLLQSNVGIKSPAGARHAQESQGESETARHEHRASL